MGRESTCYVRQRRMELQFIKFEMVVARMSLEKQLFIVTFQGVTEPRLIEVKVASPRNL
jgi:hypothetical protein